MLELIVLARIRRVCEEGVACHDRNDLPDHLLSGGAMV
jgi:hypothetical protein